MKTKLVFKDKIV